MKITMIVVRVILGLIFTTFSLAYFFNMMPEGDVNKRTELFITGLSASGYLMPLTKFIELFCGIAFLSGRFVPLASVVIFPIVLNIFLFHLFLEINGIMMSAVILAANLFLAYYYRERYSQIVRQK